MDSITGPNHPRSRKKSGELLALAEPLLNTLLTLGRNLPCQQNLNTKKRIAVLIVRARSNRIQDLLPVIPKGLTALDSIQPRQVIRVGSVRPT
jgi:hypothetical protein